MLNKLLLSAIVIKSCIQGQKNRKTKLGFFFRCVTFRSVVQIERLFINFAIQTGEVVAVNRTAVHTQIQKLMGKGIQG